MAGLSSGRCVLLQGGDPERIDRAMKAVLSSFGKPDLAEIQRAAVR